MTGRQANVLSRPAGEHARTRSRRPVVLPVAVAVDGAALAVLAGLDGSAIWQVTRVLVMAAVTALAIWLTLRQSRAVRGAAALVLGIAGTVAGAGVTAAHLSTAGLDTSAVLAAVALASGLLLLIGGAAALIRATPGWWRLTAIPVAVVLAWFVLLPLTMAVFATNRPPGPLTSATPATYGLDYRPVTFSTADGVRLSAWYVTPRNGAAVVLLPGSGSTRSAVLRQGVILARHGYGVLLVDTRGHGLSAGHAMDFGWWGGRDVAAAVSFLARQPGVRPGKIGAVGESMGGEQALAAMGADRRIRAVVAEAATGEQVADHGWMPHGAAGAPWLGLEWVQYTAAGLISGAPRPMSIPDALRAAAPRPALLIAGGAVPDEPVAARWFRAASPATVRVWVVPHAGHTQGLATAPKAWAAHVVGFLNAALHPLGA